jgi:hypothetical protein
VDRSMGPDGLYPFVLLEPVFEKMRFIHATIDESPPIPPSWPWPAARSLDGDGQPMHLGRPTGAASGRRRFQYLAEAGYACVTMEAISDAAVASSAAVRKPLTYQHLAQQRPGD